MAEWSLREVAGARVNDDGVEEGYRVLWYALIEEGMTHRGTLALSAPLPAGLVNQAAETAAERAAKARAIMAHVVGPQGVAEIETNAAAARAQVRARRAAQTRRRIV